MELPVNVKHKIVEYLTSLPNIEDEHTRRAFVYSAGLDEQLENLMNFSASGSASFFQLLVRDLLRFGELHDGRDALEAVLEASKHYVGVNRKPYCDLLIQERRYHRQLEKTTLPGFQHDILISYAFHDNKPLFDSHESWVTKFERDFTKQLMQKSGEIEQFTLNLLCLDYSFEDAHEIPAERITRVQQAATLVVLFSRKYLDAYRTHPLKDEIDRMIEERTKQHSTVFLVEPDDIETKFRPPVFCGLQSYSFTDEYEYTNRVYELSYDVFNTLQNMQQGRKASAAIRETFPHTSPEPLQTTSTQDALLTNMAFINVAPVDASLGNEIAKSLTKDGMICIKPLQGETVSENRSFFEETVAMCECLIIIYGQVRPQWVVRQVGEILKISGQQKQKIIYDGPPEQKPDLPVVFPKIPGLHVLVCHKGICEDCEPKLHHLIQASH